MAKPAKQNKAKKSNPLFTWVRADVYKQTLWFSIGQTDQQLKKSLLKEVMNITKTQVDSIVDYTSRESSMHMGRFSVAEGLHIIRLYDLPNVNDPYFHGILAHEVLHATFHILGYRGVELSDESEEAYTYLQDYFITEIYRTLLPLK